MAERAEIRFVKLQAPKAGSAVLLTDENLNLGPVAEGMGDGILGRIKRAAAASKFAGKPMKTLQLLAPEGVDLDRIVLLGVGEPEKLKADDWLKLGGAAAGASAGEGEVTLILQLPRGVEVSAEQAAAVALGIALRAYSFDKYKTKKKNDEAPKPKRFAIAVGDPKAAGKAWSPARALADGVAFARDLVNEPANVLGPEEFAEQLRGLAGLGVDVEVLGETELAGNGMRALLGVAQGSARPPRVVILRWRGGGKEEKPVVFIGKGVVFDTGGISIKPSAGMEEMKGDMGGAAAVAGLLQVLAARKAKVNATGVIGIVENMPDGKAQRPGDVVTSMSGQTIEVINTDAEGRLVLADVLTYIQRNEEPVAMIDLATLTGAVIVALGHHHAGLFSNNDGLADELVQAGRDSGEKVWRLPLGPEYDKMIDSKIADMKNTGGRYAGSITGAQFIQRFVEKDTPWAHLDVAGTAMGSPSTETNQSWGSGFGVRLLDQFVRARYESGKA